MIYFNNTHVAGLAKTFSRLNTHTHNPLSYQQHYRGYTDSYQAGISQSPEATRHSRGDERSRPA